MIEGRARNKREKEDGEECVGVVVEGAFGPAGAYGGVQ